MKRQQHKGHKETQCDQTGGEYELSRVSSLFKVAEKMSPLKNSNVSVKKQFRVGLQLKFITVKVNITNN